MSVRSPTGLICYQPNQWLISLNRAVRRFGAPPHEGSEGIRMVFRTTVGGGKPEDACGSEERSHSFEDADTEQRQPTLELSGGKRCERNSTGALIAL